MLWQDAQLVLARQLVVLGHALPPMREVQAAAPPGDLDGLPDEREGHRVAIRLEAHQVIVGDPPRLARLQPEARLAPRGDERALLAAEAIRRALVGGAVDPHVGDLGLPLPELRAQVLLVDEDPPGEEVALEVLHARLHLPLGLGAVGPAEMRLEPPVVGELLEGGVPDDASVAPGLADGAGPIVEMRARVAAEILERALVGVEELAEGFAQAGLVEAPPRIAEGQDEDVQRDGVAAVVDPRLAPVDLALLARRRLEAHRRPLCGLVHVPQGPHEALHRFIAAAVAPALAQLLEEDARRVLDLRRPALQIRQVLGEQGVGSPGPCVGLPRSPPQDAPHGLPVQPHLPGDLRLRSPLDVKQPVHLSPAVLTDHAPLPGWCDLGASVAVRRCCARQQYLAHQDALLCQEGWGIFNDHTWGLLGDR